MAKQEFSIPALMQRLTSEASAYELLEELRWNGVPVCPHCGSANKHYFLKPKGEGRKTRTGSISERRVWKCKDCRRQFTVLVGTVFHGSKIPVRTWVLVVLEMCASKNGVSAREIERKYDLTPKSAWFMLHRIREAMRYDPMAAFAHRRHSGRRDVHWWQPEESPRFRPPRGGEARSRVTQVGQDRGVLASALRDTGGAFARRP